MTPDIQSPTAPAFRHSVMIIDSDEVVRQVLVPAVRQAMTEADKVLIAVSDDTARLLREELVEAAGQLEWGDTAAFYQRLGFAYENFRRYLAAARAAGLRIHVFAEPDVTGDADEAGAVDRTAAYLAYESICNETYAQYGCEVTCLWDARRHSTLMIENVRSLHNHELGPQGREPSLGYVGPRHYLAGRNEVPLPPAGPPEWTVDLDDLDGLPRLHAEVQDWAGRHGFAGSAAADVLLAVGEVATNGLVHGRPPVRVYGWRQHNTLVVQADDQGGIPLPPLAGYLPPGQQPPSQRGLWLARQLADVVQARTADGVTSVRLYFPYRLTHRNPPRLAAHG